ncbi:MAG TPA: hypothetical protein PKC11_14065 [Agitococcus sp.]|nr:hypothetical protein [Agitococcus sp.]HMY01498.1 hypothetical protein [Agitococcus sp.]
MSTSKKYRHRYGKKNAPKPKPTKTVGLVIYGDCKVYEIWQAIKFEVRDGK